MLLQTCFAQHLSVCTESCILLDVSCLNAAHDVAQVWLTAKLDAAGTVQLAADSDAILPRGFAAVLVLALSGTRPEALLEMNLVALFGDLCLHAASLTPSRTNGFLNMLEAVRKRVRMLSTALPSCASLVIERDGIMPQVRPYSWSIVHRVLWWVNKPQLSLAGSKAITA
jgi:hypothetical protein